MNIQKTARMWNVNIIVNTMKCFFFFLPKNVAG